ncbi:MAG: protein kinase [Planctomycetes bacterium]|nr:protein kinase [Planctomycetota bacterium]
MPKLYIENGVDRGKSYIIKKDEPFFAGRDKAAQVVISDEMASRRHFQIEHRDAKYYIRDLDSSNGTFLNGSLVRSVEVLAPNDRLQVGSTIITFQDDKPHPLIGREISGYRILDRIGRGGMGTVYRALQTSLDRIVALKVLAPHLVKNTSFVNLFIREARAAGALSHPNIVQVYDVGVHEDVYFFSMEYIPDGSVEDLLNRVGPIPLARALRMVQDAAQGLQYAEQIGIIHRDIKPGNLMIGAGGVVKIGDLGISRSTEGEAQASQKDGVSGSPHYIAPEQARGLDIDSRADIYSLGCSFYQMLSGSTPFRGTTPREVILKHLKEEPPSIADRVEGLPSDIATLVGRMMAKRVDERVSSASDLLGQLAPLVRKYQDSRAGATTSGRRRVLRWVGLLLAVAASLGLGAAGVYIKVHRDNVERAERSARERAAQTIDGLAGRVAAEDIDGFDEQSASLDLGQFNDEELDRIAELRTERDALVAARARRERIESARTELSTWSDQATERSSKAESAPWEQRVELFRTLAAELKAFRQRFDDLSGEAFLVDARGREQDFLRRAEELETLELAARADLDRIHPVAQGYAVSEDFRAARETLERFDRKRFEGTAADAQVRDAIIALEGQEARCWESLGHQIDELVGLGEYAVALARLQTFSTIVAFDSVREKLEARRTEIEALREATHTDDPSKDLDLARTAIGDAWREWATDLDLSVRELAPLRDQQRLVRDPEALDWIRRQISLLERWSSVERGLDGRRLATHSLETEGGEVAVRDLRLDDDKIRYEDTRGNPAFRRWRELSPRGRARLLAALAQSPEEKLYAGLLGKITRTTDPAIEAAWSSAIEDPGLVELKPDALFVIELDW